MTPDEFLNPKSMLTPGVAGGVVMLVTNTLAAQFSFARNWTGLAMSFLVGLVVLLHDVKPLWLRLGLYILNSLVIFAVAAGANQAGSAATDRAGARLSTAALTDGGPSFFSPWF
jgi:hypothetical protein